MEARDLPRELIDVTLNLLKEELLDGQFRHLQSQLPPQAISELLSLYITETDKIIINLHSLAEQREVDFVKIDDQTFQLKGSSISIGAPRIKDSCEAICKCCKEKNFTGFVNHLEQLREEHSILKSKLEPMLSILQEIVASDGANNEGQ